ncbi:MAG: hypothetical protein E7550_03360 [Ruminococcaceae bacterium]|nr:hypothetical protein [Oscillospiraceae bacterium]
MKRFLAFLISAVLIFSLSACSEPAMSDNPSSDTPPASAPAGATALSGDKNNIGFGTITDGDYLNQFLGLGARLGDKWVFFSEEELLAINKIEASTEAEQKNAMDEAKTLYLMYAQEIDTFNTIKIKAEKLGSEEVARADIAALLNKKSAEVKATLEKMGAADIKSEITELSIADLRVSAAVTSSSHYGNASKQIDFLLRSGEYMATVTVTAYSDPADILSLFYFE